MKKFANWKLQIKIVNLHKYSCSYKNVWFVHTLKSSFNTKNQVSNKLYLT